MKKIKNKLETDIFNSNTPEFFINMKSIPDKKSSERKAFILSEKDKCRKGINVGQVWIPGSLYFHLNYYHLQGDDLKSGKKAVFLPRLRDNEWIFFNDYEESFKKKLIYTYFGLRQAGKTEMEVSLCLRELCLFKETEAIALFSRKPDKDTFVKKMQTAIAYGEPFIIKPNIDKDWNKEEIRFGLTGIDNTPKISSRLYIYNTQDGKKIQIGSGKTPSFMLMDEIAINPFRGVYDVVEPALLSDAGTLRCSPIFTFTGGETDKAKDAENFVKYPVDKQFCTTLDDGTVVGGRFLSGLYRKDCKEPKKFSEYLGITTNTWLDDYTIHVSDFDKASKKIEKEKEEASKSPDKNTLLLKRIFFPLNLEDVFLSESNNNFPRQAIEQQQKWLKENYTPLYVDFYRGNNGEVLWNHSELKPIDKFPVKPSDNHRAPVCIYEQPVKDAPQGLYVIGIDPIHSNDSTDKIVSLASITVFKRTLSPLDEIKDEIVCTYAGRPKEIVEFHELAIMIAEYYNAVGTVLYEASEMSLRQHFYLKKKSRFLAQSLDLTKSINERTKITSANGLAPTTKNQQHYMGLEVEYAKEELVEIDDDGNEYIKTGVYRVKDTMLLEEMKHYKSKGGSSRGIHDGNFDRIISFGCALTLAKWLDVHYPIKVQKAKNYVSVDNISKPKTKKIFGIDITANKYNSNYSKKVPFWFNQK